MIINGSNFSFLNKYMMETQLKLVNNENVAKLLTYTDKSALSNPTPINPKGLIDSKIYSYAYVPDIQTSVDSYITILFNNFRPSSGGYFKDSTITFNILVHEDINNTNHGYRLFLLMQEVDKLFNDATMGIGKLNFVGGDYLSLPKPYIGYFLKYKIIDFD